MKFLKHVLNVYAAVAIFMLAVLAMILLIYLFFADIGELFENTTFADVRMMLGVYFFGGLILSILSMKLHWMNKKLYITTVKPIKENDLYLDSLVHPSLIQYPLVMWGFADGDKRKIIQSHSGTTSPVSCSRRIWLIVG